VQMGRLLVAFLFCVFAAQEGASVTVCDGNGECCVCACSLVTSLGEESTQLLSKHRDDDLLAVLEDAAKGGKSGDKTVDLLQAKTHDALDDEKARVADIAVALRAMMASYIGCTQMNTTKCSTYSAQRATINYDADHAALDANEVIPDHYAAFVAMKDRFNQSVASLDEMHQNCSTNVNNCVTQLAFSTSVSSIIETYRNELAQLQPDAIPALTATLTQTELLERQTAGGNVPPVLLQSTFFDKGGCGACPEAACGAVQQCCEDALVGESQQLLQNESESTELLSILEATGVEGKEKNAATVGWDCS